MDQGDDRSAIRRARGRFAAMATAYGLGVFNDGFFRQSAMLLAVAAGLTHLQGWLMAAFALPYLLLSAQAGWLADRFVKRHVVIATKALELAAMVCGAVGLVSGSWGLLAAMVFTMGLQSCLFNPALNGSIPELYPRWYVTRANAVLKAVVMTMILAGIALAGVVLGINEPLWAGVPAGRWLVAGGALAVALAGLAAALAVPARPAADPAAPFPWAGPVRTLGTLWRLRADRPLGVAVAANTFAWFVGALLQPTVNVLAMVELGRGEAMAGYLIAAQVVGIAVGGLLAGRVARGRRWQDLLAPCVLAMAGLFALFALLPALPAAWRVPAALCLLMLAGVAGGLVIVPCEAFIQVRPQPHRRGATIAAGNFAVFAGIFLAGPAANLLLELGRASLALAAIGALCLAAGAALWVALHGRPRVSTRAVDALWVALVRALLALRYRVTVRGAARIAKRGRRGILFLANHPALIDPILLYSRLFWAFRLRSLADRTQIDRLLIRRLARRVGVIAIPDAATEGAAATPAVREALRQCAELLRHGENLLLYPAGRTLRGQYEDLGGAAAADLLLQEVPEVRVVLIRTRGLWGSSFGRAAGSPPAVGRTLSKGALGLLTSGLFFAPRRRVTVELVEPADVPPGGDRQRLNRYLESFFNVGAEPNTYVPYSIWGGPTRRLAEPPGPAAAAAGGVLPADVPPAIRQAVMEYVLHTLAVSEVRDGDELGRDLGMDSLGRADLAIWLAGRFGVGVMDGEALRTVGDVMLAAWGEALAGPEVVVTPPPPRWFARPMPAQCPYGLAQMTVCQAFLHQARRGPGRPIMVDAADGRLKTYRDVVTAVEALRGPLAGLPGDNLGILLPASVAANVTYLAALFAGKTPVMVNWTLGARALAAALASTDTRAVLTARRLVRRLEAQGVELAPLRDRLVYLEDLAASLGRAARLAAAGRARLSWSALERAAGRAPHVAAALFTSGSEGLPKTVPLTHRNLLANLAGAFSRYVPRDDDVVLGILPPFHAFGLTATMLLATCLGARVVYCPNPTDAATLVRAIEAYRATMLIATPTFLRGILRAAAAESARATLALAPLRLVICGAEACPPALAAELARLAGQAVVLEGYGVTECGPIITFNDQRAPRPGTIGRLLESYEHILRDPQTGQPLGPGASGELLVRGPCVFEGYWGDAPAPWVELAGRLWYPTCDVVADEGDGVLRFVARLRRFVKRGGEMISLPAIETALAEQLGDAGGDGPTLAVVASESEGRAELALFTTRGLQCDQANRAIRQAGLSALHSIQRVIRVDALPLLGTGKIDYRALERRLAWGAGQ